jgi:hypothetical protein
MEFLMRFEAITSRKQREGRGTHQEYVTRAIQSMRMKLFEKGQMPMARLENH